MFLSCHVRIWNWIHTLYLPECQRTPCSKQARYLKFKWLQRGLEPTKNTPYTLKIIDGVLRHGNRKFLNYWSNNSEAAVRRFLKNRCSKKYRKICKKISVLLSFSIKMQGWIWEIFKNALFRRPSDGCL